MVEIIALLIVNYLLTMFTLGIYYPWAKAAKRKYLFSNTVFAGSPFIFNGTGKEMFMGFIKLYAIGILWYGALIYAASSFNTVLKQILIAVIYLLFFLLIPFAIHSSVKYRASRTTWRGIHFGYRGEMGSLVKTYFVGMFLTIITLGIYGAWFTVNIRKYIVENIRFGNINFGFNGTGKSYFILLIKGYLLSIITLGIYLPWFAKDLANFNIDNTTATQNGEELTFKSSITGGDYFVLMITNFLLIIFTLGIATPWVIMRSTRFILENISLEGNFDADNLLQTESEYKDAIGDDLADVLDIGIV